MFKDSINDDYQMIKVSPKYHRYLAMGLLARGDISFSDMNRNIKKLKKEINMIHWNKEGFKYGICGAPPIGQVIPYSFIVEI